MLITGVGNPELYAIWGGRAKATGYDLVVAESHRLLEAQPGSVAGDFYAEKDSCIQCGAPQEVAPDLVGQAEDGSCIWKKQPQTPEEVDRAINVLNASCRDAHRYAGTDAAVMSRVQEPGLCDNLEDRERLSAKRHAAWVDEQIRQSFRSLVDRWFSPRKRDK